MTLALYRTPVSRSTWACCLAHTAGLQASSATTRSFQQQHSCPESAHLPSASTTTAGAKPPLPSGRTTPGPSWSVLTGFTSVNKPAPLLKTTSFGTASGDRISAGAGPAVLARSGSLGTEQPAAANVRHLSLDQTASGAATALSKGRFNHVDPLLAVLIVEDGLDRSLQLVRTPAASKSLASSRPARTSAPQRLTLPPLSAKGGAGFTSRQGTSSKPAAVPTTAPAAAEAPVPGGSKFLFRYGLEQMNLFAY